MLFRSVNVGKCFAEHLQMGLLTYATHLVPLEEALMSSHMIYYKLQILETFQMEFIDDLFLFFVLGHVATEMMGDDRPYSLVLEMMSS